MAVLALREYERIYCGDQFDPEHRVITPAQHRVLERFAEDYKHRFKVSVFQHGPRLSLVAQNFVGIINLGQHQIEILPKIETNTAQVRTNLIKMLAAVLSLDLHAIGPSLVDKTNDNILEILIRLFSDQLWQAVRRGMVRRYETRQENLSVLRGRLQISAQIRQNIVRPDRLFCEYDEFSENNVLNRVLKAALRILHRVSRNPANQRSVAELLFCFHDVDDIKPGAIKWHLVAIDRLSARYQPLVAMARLFIEGCSPDVVSGNGEGFALLFDMNELFESYIGRLTQQLFVGSDLRVSLQGPRKHLAVNESDAPVFELRPDIVISKQGSPQCIIDTKWKRLKEAAYRDGVTSSDVYQMYAYSSKYLTPDVILLYPHHGELGQWQPRRAEYRIGSSGWAPTEEQRRIGISTIDLRDLDAIPHQLGQILPNLSPRVSSPVMPVFLRIAS